MSEPSRTARFAAGIALYCSGMMVLAVCSFHFGRDLFEVTLLLAAAAVVTGAWVCLRMLFGEPVLRALRRGARILNAFFARELSVSKTPEPTKPDSSD